MAAIFVRPIRRPAVTREAPKDSNPELVLEAPRIFAAGKLAKLSSMTPIRAIASGHAGLHVDLKITREGDTTPQPQAGLIQVGDGVGVGDAPHKETLWLKPWAISTIRRGAHWLGFVKILLE